MAYLEENLIWFVIFSLLPSLAWLIFFLKKDPRPEPKKAILITFLLGVYFSLPTLDLELFLKKASNFIFSIFLKEAVAGLIVFAFIEELAKFAGVRIWASRKKYFDEKSDPFLYMITSALGFACAENFLILLGGFNYNFTPFSSLFFQSLFLTSFLRFLGPTLLHCFSSGLLGCFWSYSILLRKKTIFLLGLLGSVSLHSLFNFCIILSPKSSIVFILFFFFLALFFLKFIYNLVLRKNY